MIQGQEMVACAICGELLNSKIKITRHFEKKIIDMDLNHSGVDPRTLLWGFPPLFATSEGWKTLYKN